MHSQTGNSHLAAAVAAAWPDITVEARVKRAAALALLASPIHSSTASQLAHVVRGSLGSSIKDLGCRLSFQEILQQAPAVFRFTAGPSPHEARIVLNQQGLQYLGQQQQQHSFPPLAATQTPMARASSTSSSAALSPTAVAATAACQGLSFAAVARSPGARILTGPGSASAVSSQQQQRQQQHLQLGAVIDRPPPPPPVAAAAKGSLRMSSARLFDYVSGRTWHADSPQLDTARQALAVFLVQQANPVLSSSTAVSIDPNAYVTTSPVAGTAEQGLGSFSTVPSPSKYCLAKLYEEMQSPLIPNSAVTMPFFYRGGAPPTGWPHTNSRAEPDCRGPEAKPHR